MLSLYGRWYWLLIWGSDITFPSNKLIHIKSDLRKNAKWILVWVVKCRVKIVLVVYDWLEFGNRVLQVRPGAGLLTILCTYIRVFVSCHSVTKNSLLLPFHLWIWYILLGTLSILIPFALGPIPGPFMTSYPFLETYSRQLEPEGTRLFCPFSFFFFFFFLINLFIFNFGCIGSLLLCVGFL